MYDYVRMCKYFYDDCQECPVFDNQIETCLGCEEFIRNYPDKANEIILKWVKEHPIKTRQDELLNVFPIQKMQLNDDNLTEDLVAIAYALNMFTRQATEQEFDIVDFTNLLNKLVVQDSLENREAEQND